MAKKSRKAEEGASTQPLRASDGRRRRVTVRHYCQGIGDCHLLSFPKADGTHFWMLIDCGIHSSVSGRPGDRR